MLKIVIVPNPILNAVAKKVEKFDSTLARLVGEMDKTLEHQTDPQGVGLAAPQIGESLAIFIMKPTIDSTTEVFINPRIVKMDEPKPRSAELKTPIKRKKGKKNKLEGCLSIPKIWGPIKRAKKVLLEYQDMKGNKKSKWFSGFKSIIIQHEIDHLQGVLFTNRSLEQGANLYEENDGKLEKITLS